MLNHRSSSGLSSAAGAAGLGECEPLVPASPLRRFRLRRRRRERSRDEDEERRRRGGGALAQRRKLALASLALAASLGIVAFDAVDSAFPSPSSSSSLDASLSYRPSPLHRLNRAVRTRTEALGLTSASKFLRRLEYGDCSLPTPSDPPDDKPVNPYFLAAYPGSGAHLAMNLAESLTGLKAGSEFHDRGSDSNRIVIKTLYPAVDHGVRGGVVGSEGMTHGVLFLRNPLTSMLSKFTLWYEMGSAVSPRQAELRAREATASSSLAVAAEASSTAEVPSEVSAAPAVAEEPQSAATAVAALETASSPSAAASASSSETVVPSGSKPKESALTTVEEMLALAAEAGAAAYGTSEVESTGGRRLQEEEEPSVEDAAANPEELEEAAAAAIEKALEIEEAALAKASASKDAAVPEETPENEAVSEEAPVTEGAPVPQEVFAEEAAAEPPRADAVADPQAAALTAANQPPSTLETSDLLDGPDPIIRRLPEEEWIVWRDLHFSSELQKWVDFVRYWTDVLPPSQRVTMSYENITSYESGPRETARLATFLIRQPNVELAEDHTKIPCVWNEAVHSVYGGAGSSANRGRERKRHKSAEHFLRGAIDSEASHVLRPFHLPGFHPLTEAQLAEAASVLGALRDSFREEEDPELRRILDEYVDEVTGPLQ